MRSILLALAAALAFATIPAAAWECEPTTSQPEFTMGDSYSGIYYFDWDWCQPECLMSYWYYEESNGMDGLQRNDDAKDDTCGGIIDGDRILY